MTTVLPDIDTKQDPLIAKPARVILYNDDWHSFDDVIHQLVKATACTLDAAGEHAFIVHTQGRSQVFDGPRGDCEKVAGILREIRLQVEVDWDD